MNTGGGGGVFWFTVQSLRFRVQGAPMVEEMCFARHDDLLLLEEVDPLCRLRGRRVAPLVQLLRAERLRSTKTSLQNHEAVPRRARI